MSSLGNGYLSGNMLVPFPFKDGQSTPWTGEVQAALEKCFVDAAVHISGTSVPEGGWPAIGEFAPSGSSLSFKVSVGEHEVAVSVAASSSPFPIVRGSAPWGSYVLILSSEGLRGLSECDFPAPVRSSSSPSGRSAGVWLELCAKCVTVTPVGLSSIRVFDGVHSEESGPHFVLSGDVSVRPGNNMAVSGDEDGNSVQLDAVPGAGLGVLPCNCGDKPAVSQFVSRDGHSRIFNDTCYDLEPLGGGVIQIHSKCTACCTCDMYESIVKDRLVPLANALRQARTELYGLLGDYESAVSKFNYRISHPTDADYTLSITGMPVGGMLSPRLGSTDVRGRMARCAFTAILGNKSPYNLTAWTETIITGAGEDVVEISATGMDAAGVQSTVSADRVGDVAGRQFAVGPGQSMVVNFISRKRIKVGEVATNTGYTGEIRVGGIFKDLDGRVLFEFHNVAKRVEV